MEEQQEHELHSVRSIFAGRIFEEGLLKSVISRLHTWSKKKKKKVNCRATIRSNSERCHGAKMIFR